jgi:hypothetical protein
VPSGLGLLGRVLFGLGVLVALLGLSLILADRFPGMRIGRLPGDIRVERDGVRFYFPLATSVLLSLVPTLIFWLFSRR